ncbi:MAG: hypothetical protein IKQ72_02565 [Bacteroidaceae bacterium]|nr:hypothetical protein [Bacteroidaceae bacterium]
MKYYKIDYSNKYKYLWNHTFCLILSLLVFTSCLYDKMYNLDDDELAWMSPYEEGDTILFRSSTLDEYDSLFVNEKAIHNSTSRLVSNVGADVFNASGSFHAKMSHNKNQLEFRFLIIKENKTDLFVRLNFADRFSTLLRGPSNHLYLEDYNGVLKMFEYTVDDVVYNDLISVGDYNSELLNVRWNSCECDHFLWSKSNGLILYKYSDTDSVKGDVYTFYKRLPYQKPKNKSFWSFLFGE